ncbi:LysR family transcriptional regulator [Pseudomonas oryzihabitans]|uniref:LysR family transcriptional regulator n=1 Tax=Pseudomonas oryzihabitans TaxID=47885 RepID=UPI0011235F43|nr:LysR family transcriptional regulator [Pseudomonas psychrotolerans]QDD88215.1 LysR family transcriptional regulator [Pseudomonas psychrotolerans]
MDRWQAMRVFVKVAETQSFARTARELHLSAPAVTRMVAGLEDLIGARLLVRTTRSVKPTEAGVRYLQDCRRILDEIAEAELAAAGHQAKPSGTLAITAPVLFGQLHVLPLVLEFLGRHPQMRVRTLFVDRQVNLLDEGLDVALRIGQLPDSGFTAIQVGRMRRVVCASPAYLEAEGTPTTPAALRDHRILASQGAWASPEWRFARGQRVVVDPLLQCNTNEAAITAAKAGWGLTRALHYQIAPALAEGALRIVLEDHEDSPLPVHLVYPEGRQAAAKVRAFVELAVASLRSDPLLGRGFVG